MGVFELLYNINKAISLKSFIRSKCKRRNNEIKAKSICSVLILTNAIYATVYLSVWTFFTQQRSQIQAKTFIFLLYINI